MGSTAQLEACFVLLAIAWMMNQETVKLQGPPGPAIGDWQSRLRQEHQWHLDHARQIDRSAVESSRDTLMPCMSTCENAARLFRARGCATRMTGGLEDALVSCAWLCVRKRATMKFLNTVPWSGPYGGPLIHLAADSVKVT